MQAKISVLVATELRAVIRQKLEKHCDKSSKQDEMDRTERARVVSVSQTGCLQLVQVTSSVGAVRGSASFTPRAKRDVE